MIKERIIMKVKFNELVFNTEGLPNISALRIQTNIKKDNYTIDDILSEVKSSDEITFYEDDDTVTGIYPGYTKPIAVCIVFVDGVETISVEVENENISDQINALTERVDTLEHTYSVENPLVINLPAASGNTVTYHDVRVMSNMTVLSVKDYKTGVEVPNIKVVTIDGGIIVSNITTQTSLTITLI